MGKKSKASKIADKAAKKVAKNDTGGLQADHKAMDKEKKAAKKLAKKTGTTTEDPGKVLPALGVHLIQEATPAAIVKILEDAARLPTTPSGVYNIQTAAGMISITKGKSATPGKEKLYWSLDSEKMTRPAIYKIVKDTPTLKGPSTIATGDSAGAKDEKIGPSSKDLKDIYKKKQLINALKDSQIFPKAIIGAVKKDMTEKTMDGAGFITTMMDASSDELTLDMINKVFGELLK